MTAPNMPLHSNTIATTSKKKPESFPMSLCLLFLLANPYYDGTYLQLQLHIPFCKKEVGIALQENFGGQLIEMRSPNGSVAFAYKMRAKKDLLHLLSKLKKLRHRFSTMPQLDMLIQQLTQYTSQSVKIEEIHRRKLRRAGGFGALARGDDSLVNRIAGG